ncbi:MAG: hypothetical protein KDA60_04430 [Planctomycetales bacterium]|nr:hypothetical protein [Planctomycetales bacterium]
MSVTAGRPPSIQGDATAASRSLDLLEIPVLGRFLKWRYSRLTLQVPLFLLSVLMVVHAFAGPQLAPKNLATLLTWVHFRGMVVLVLLLGGNLFCMACPFMLPREIARRFVTPRWTWPRWLRNKWLSLALFIAVLFVYEWLDLWANPSGTGMLIVGYFAVALLVDCLFQRASFCKYVCPVGQFNFISSTMSPVEITVRDQDLCSHCETKDCIRGSRHALLSPPAPAAVSPSDTSAVSPLPIVQRGCELALFQPRKVDNWDCTFCLDCIYACPHDNVGIVTRLPASALPHSESRSGIGKLNRRLDFTALIVVFTFGSLLNAFAMISPIYVVEQSIAESLGLRMEWPILVGLFGIALVIEPAVLLGAAAWLTRRFSGSEQSLLSIVKRFAVTLIPLGFGVWLAHYGFHFFTGCWTVIPVAQSAARDFTGMSLLGSPKWELGGLPEEIVGVLETFFLSLGLLGSLLVTWQVSRQFAPRHTVRVSGPWFALLVMLFATACWVMSQPMDMRGTFLGG